MHYLYQHDGRYFAQVTGGLETIAAEEMSTLGAEDIAETYRGLYFSCDAATLYRLNYESRLVTRILAPLIRFRCHNPEYLYRKGMEINWQNFMSVDHTFSINANVSNSKIRHSQYAALRLKDAIVDSFRENTGKRPNVDRYKADAVFNLHIHDNMATISLDTSGSPLHKRGYRKKTGEAPMQETLAAAIIKLSGWRGDVPLYDPMCGSGTLLAEALMSGAGIPANYLRPVFGFMRLPDYQPQFWKQLQSAAEKKIDSSIAAKIFGSDINSEMIMATRGNLKSLPGGREIKLKVADFDSLQPHSGSILVINPPYGIRMGTEKKMERVYKQLGDFLKQQCTGCTAYIYAGNRDLIASIGLRPSWKKPLVNGKLDGRLLKIDLY